MIEEIYNYFTIDTLYYWVNFGVLPFWLLLIFFPKSNLTKYLVTSIIPILILSGTYIFMLYMAYLNSYYFVGNFNLYLGINDLLSLFSNKTFLLMFWIHFISINLFVGGWIVRDSQKLLMNKLLVILPLIVTYLIGPLGLFIYWIIRIFHSKNINLYD